MKKKRFHPKFWLFVLLLLSFAPVQAQSQGISVSYVAVTESESRLDLNVYFTVRDGNGEPIPNPSIGDQTLEVLGSDSPPMSVDILNPETPIYIVLLLDSSGSMREVMPDVQFAARAAIDQAPPNAFFSVIQFDEGVRVIEDFTDNHERVKAAISGVRSEANRGTCLYDATFDAIGRLDRQITSPQEQRAIILFTDGRDQLRINDPAPCSVQTFGDVVRAARPTDITRPSTPIHTIGLYGRGNDTTNIDENALRGLANETFAFSAFGNATQLDSLFERIMTGLNSQLVAIASNVVTAQGQNQAILSFTDRDRRITSAPFVFSANFPHNAPPGEVSIVDNGIDINEDDGILSFAIGVNNSAEAARLIARVEDGGGVRAIDDIIIENPSNAVAIEVDVSRFEPEQEYVIKLFALDENGEFITNEDGEVLLARGFNMPSIEVTSFEFEIDTVTVDYETPQMIIDLDIPDDDKIAVQSYAGFISDSDVGAKLFEFPPTVYSEPRIFMPLPAVLAEPGEQRDLELTMILQIFDSVNGELKEVEAVRDFSPVPPARKGIIGRTIDNLRANPYILLIILGVLLAVALLITRRKKEAEAAIVPVERPPIENKTVLFDDPIFRDLHNRDEEEGFDAVMTVPPEDKPVRAAQSSTKVKVTVLRMPKEQVLESRVFNMFPLTVGREQADLTVREDPYISRKHVEIGVDGNGVYVRDLESKSGVRIKGEKIEAGEKVRIGRKTRLKLSSKTELDIAVAQ